MDKLYGNFYGPAKKLIDVECDACIVFVRFIQDLSRANKSEDEIIKAAVDLCSHLHIHNVDPYVCSGIVSEFKVRAVFTLDLSQCDVPLPVFYKVYLFFLKGNSLFPLFKALVGGLLFMIIIIIIKYLKFTTGPQGL